MSAKTGSRPGKTSVSAAAVSVSAARVGGERTGEVSSSDSSRADSPTRRAEASAEIGVGHPAEAGVDEHVDR